MPLPIHLWLIHPEPAACLAFRERFDGLQNVRVVPSRFEELDLHDCFVTAANSKSVACRERAICYDGDKKRVR